MESARIIRIARERSGLSKRELARRAATSPAAIVKYESGQMSPTVETLNRIVAAAGWRIELTLLPESPDVFDRARVIHELLEFVHLVPMKTPSHTIEFPRFKDALAQRNH